MMQKLLRQTAIAAGCLFVVILSAPVLAAQLPENGFEVPAKSGAVSNALAEPDAANPPATGRRLSDVIRAGGPIMFPIIFCSFLLVVFVIERTISLRKARIIPGPFVNRFLEQISAGELNRESAIALCDKNDSPVARIFRAGIQKWGRSAVEVEQAIMDAGERVTCELRRFLRVIKGIETLCPLLGLFGTVLGMIQSFDAIATVDPSVADPKALIASGISVALITTAAGLTVAIPALVSYLYFVGIVDRRILELDSLGMKVVNLISAEAVGSDGARGSSRKNKAA